MSLFNQLLHNKGTVSSALGKTLGQKVLNSDGTLLTEAIQLITFELANKQAKSIRSGAAKIVEIVAKQKPALVAPALKQLLPALTVQELQTRWMIIRTMGFCARLNKLVAEQAIPYVKQYIQHKEGLCLASSADLFLGDFGALGKSEAKKIFPLLKMSINNCVLNEVDWLLEAFMKITKNLDMPEKNIIKNFAQTCTHEAKKSTQKRARKLLKILSTI